MSRWSPTRREFLGAFAGGFTALKTGISGKAWAAATAEEKRVNGIPYRTLGKTGVRVSMVGLGGFHIGIPILKEEGIRLVRRALDEGINFLDNSWDYHEGESERRMGEALKGEYRHRAFLMTKIDGRTKAAAALQIDESLARLQTDHLDLLQFHEIIRYTDPDHIFGQGGAIEAAAEAKKAGKVRFIGFTGHKTPDVHLKMLQAADAYGFSFDTVQMPLNVMDPHFNSFQTQVLPQLVERRIGVLGMKSMGDGKILMSKVATGIECLHYAMNLPTSVVITGCEREDVLLQALKAARTFKPMTVQAAQALLDRSKPFGETGKYEVFKTTDKHDSTSKHPEWLGTT